MPDDDDDEDQLAPLASITADDLVAGSTLAGRVSGALRYIYPPSIVGDSVHLRFMLSVALRRPTDYAHDLDNHVGRYHLACTLSAPRSPGVHAAVEDDYTELRKDQGRHPVVLDLTGARVVSVAAPEPRGGGGARAAGGAPGSGRSRATVVAVEAEGPRRVEVRGRQRTMLAAPKPPERKSAASERWDFFADAPSAAVISPAATRSAAAASAPTLASKALAPASSNASAPPTATTAALTAAADGGQARRSVYSLPQLHTSTSTSVSARAAPHDADHPDSQQPPFGHAPSPTPPRQARQSRPTPSDANRRAAVMDSRNTTPPYPSSQPSYPESACSTPTDARSRVHASPRHFDTASRQLASATRPRTSRPSLAPAKPPATSLPAQPPTHTPAEDPLERNGGYTGRGSSDLGADDGDLGADDDGDDDGDMDQEAIAREMAQLEHRMRLLRRKSRARTSASQGHSSIASSPLPTASKRKQLATPDPGPTATPHTAESSLHKRARPSTPTALLAPPPPPLSKSFIEGPRRQVHDISAADEARDAHLPHAVATKTPRQPQDIDAAAPSQASPAFTPTDQPGKQRKEHAERGHKERVEPKERFAATDSRLGPSLEANALSQRRPSSAQPQGSVKLNGTNGSASRAEAAPMGEERERPGAATPSSVDAVVKRKMQMAEARAKAEERVRKAAMEKQMQQQTAAESAMQLTHDMTRPFRSGRYQYTPLARLQPGTTANIMGVVIDAGEVRGGERGRDHHRSVIITDPSLRANGSDEDTVVGVFRKNATDIPAESGCPIVFRGAKITSFKGKPKAQCFSNASNEWAYLRPSGELLRVPSVAGTKQVVLTPDEHERLTALRMWYAGKGKGAGPARYDGGLDGGVHSSPASSRNTKKERLLGDVVSGQFFDATVKILRLLENDRGGDFPQFEIYVTDGTVNPGRTRNFHGVDAGLPPSAILCLLSWTPFDFPVKDGDVVFFPNLRAKDKNGLELNWSENITEAQREQGWREKRARMVDASDPKALAIEERLAVLRAAVQAGEAVEVSVPTAVEHSHSYPHSHAALAVSLPTPPIAKVSTAVFTKHTDPVNHPITPLATALADPTVPNRYRIQARVSRVAPLPGKTVADLAVLYCTRCNHEFSSPFCRSCNDRTLAFAEARWRMLVFLEIDAEAKARALATFAAARNPGALAEAAADDYPTEVAVYLGDGAADEFLPPLPVLHTGPNELDRAQIRMKALVRKVEDLLLGANFDGARTRPLIDWSIEKYSVEGVALPPPSGAGGAAEARRKSRGGGAVSGADAGGKDKDRDQVTVVMWRVFGMTSKQ